MGEPDAADAALSALDPAREGITPRIETEHPYITVFTDGSSTGGWGAGGWAWAVMGEDGAPSGVEGSGGLAWTTNQQMELLAAHEAVRALSGLVLVVSDSAYVVNCFLQRWYIGWAAKDWRKVKNADLWRPFILDVLDRRGEVRFAWIKGHSGNAMNDHVDALAKAAKLAHTEEP